MAYDLFFHSERCVIGFTMPRIDWESLSFTFPEMNPEIECYLGKKSRWQEAESGLFGYGDCAILEKMVSYVQVSVPLHQRNLRDSMLTLSFLLQNIKVLQSRHDLLQVSTGCGRHHGVSGQVSIEFKQGLIQLRETDLNEVMENMRKVWHATAIRELKKYGNDCYARVRDGRFELGCFGDACDLSMYPDSYLTFSCHNLDAPYQQATLLAGLASLFFAVKCKL